MGAYFAGVSADTQVGRHVITASLRGPVKKGIDRRGRDAAA